MSKSDLRIIELPRREKSDKERMEERNIGELMQIVKEINKCGNAIGRTNLVHDLITRILFVVAAMDDPSMQAIIGVTPKWEAIQKGKQL